MNDITCIEFRQRVGADPGTRDPGVLRHRLACRTCAEHGRALEGFDRRLAHALAIPVPAELAHRVILRATADEAAPPRRWLAAVAGLAVLAIGVTLAVQWRAAPAPDAALASDLLAHMLHEPDTLEPTAITVAHVKVREVLGRGEAGLTDPEALGTVSFARLCPFRGRLTPHLVFQGASGPVTVMVLRHVQVTEPTPFAEEGYQGVLVPMGEGSVAVIGSDDPSIQAVRGRVTRSLDLSI
jgi:hypothetical protein